MKLKINIGFSIAAHAMIVIAAIVFNRGAVSRAPESSMIVSLFESMAGVASEKQEGITIKPQLQTYEIAKYSGREEQDIKISGNKSILNEQSPASAKDDISSSAVSGKTSNHGGATEPTKTSVKTSGDGEKTVKAESLSNSRASAYALIRSAIEKARTYPVIARRRKIEGTVVTEFMITKKGLPEDIKIRTSSGSEILDSAAVDIIKKAGPMPHVEGSLIIPIKFSLTE